MFKRIYFFYLTYLMAMVYSQTLLMLWFFKNGISFIEMMFYFLTIYLLVLPISFLLQGRKFSSRTALLLGVGMSVAGVLTANFITLHAYYIFFMSLLFALNIIFFWTIYSAMHFKYSEKEEHGFKSGIYYLLFPITGALLSPLSGFIVEKLGYHFLFLSSMVLYAVPFVLIFYLPNFEFEFETSKALSEIEHPLLVAFQGYIFMLTTNIVPIFTLIFITTPFKLGNFFGYLAIFSALAAVFNSKISDRFKKRALFFYIFTSLNALSYIPLVLSKSFANWQVFSGINNLTYNLVNPFNLTMILDHAKPNIVQTMLGRQIYFTFGEIFTIVFFLIIYYFTSSLWSALIWSSLVPLLYPIVAYYQKVYLTPNQSKLSTGQE